MKEYNHDEKYSVEACGLTEDEVVAYMMLLAQLSLTKISERTQFAEEMMTTIIQNNDAKAMNFVRITAYIAMDKVAECMTAVDLTKADEKTLESIEFLIGAELKSRGSLQ